MESKTERWFVRRVGESLHDMARSYKRWEDGELTPAECRRAEHCWRHCDEIVSMTEAEFKAELVPQFLRDYRS